MRFTSCLLGSGPACMLFIGRENRCDWGLDGIGLDWAGLGEALGGVRLMRGF